MTDRPIALAGFMGAGKTTVGRLLAAELGRPFFDSDAEVERLSGRTVVDFFEAGEEPAFRRLEAEVVSELVARGAVVIALGGGALLDPGTRALLGERATTVHLHVPWHELRARLAGSEASRPLLRGRRDDELRELYERRLAVYRAAALEVDVAGRSPEAAVTAVLAAVS